VSAVAGRAVAARVMFLALALLLLACGDERPGGLPPSPSSGAPRPGADPLVTRASACPDLPRNDQVQPALQDRAADTHLGPGTLAQAEHLKAAIDRCAAPLITRLRDDMEAVTAALCACQDRACYDGLHDRVFAVFDVTTNGAAVPPAMLEELQGIHARFLACDERFAPVPAPVAPAAPPP